MACASEPQPRRFRCITLATKSHMKYPAANPCIAPLAPVQPRIFLAQSISLLSSSLHIKNKASAIMIEDCMKDVTRTFQLIAVRAGK